MSTTRGWWRWGVGVLAMVATVLTQAPCLGLDTAQWLRFGAVIALLWGLPACTWAWYLQGDPAERAAGGLGLAYVGSGLATLVLHLLPGAYPTTLAALVYLALLLIPLALPRRCPVSSRESLSWRHAAMAIVVLVALLMRMPHLGYSEFQGDEAVIMQRAAEALAGDDGQLFLHQKGPAEILVPMSLWSLTGTVTEWQMRFPFALVGILVVVVVMCLGTRWFATPRGPAASAWSGVAAGLLVAISGFLVAFSRILQYQNLVVAMGGLSLLWLTRYRERAHRGAPMLAAVFLAYGLLSHYDAILVVPAALALVTQALLKVREGHGDAFRSQAVALLSAGLIGLSILALFYLPFVADPMFSRTFSYLAGGRLGGSLFHNSLVSNWRMSTFYNSLAYVVGLVLLVGMAAIWKLGDPASWLYFVAPLGFYSFVVADPRTHVYTFYAGAALLGGVAFTRALAWITGRWRQLLVLLASGWYLLCLGYIVIVFLDHKVEYKRAWPESRHLLYPVPFADDELPPYGHFGFPYRAGWKAVEHLFDTGVLKGSYGSNEEPEITTWYVRSGVRSMCGGPDVYVVAESVQDEVPIDWVELERDYALAARIEVSDATKIRIYTRDALIATPFVLDAAAHAVAYDRDATVVAQLPFGFGREQIGHQPAGQTFGDIARLLGYDLETRIEHDQAVVSMVLYWRALVSPGRNTQIFTHLMRGDDLIAQDDGAPACNYAPTSLWEAGQLIRDERELVFSPGERMSFLEVYVGMYDLLTLDRLPVDGGGDDRLLLATLEVDAWRGR